MNPETTIITINLPLFSFFFSSLYFYLLLPSLQNKIAVSLPSSLTFPPLSPSTPHIGGTPSLTPPYVNLYPLTTLHIILPHSFLTLILHSLSDSVPQISYLTPSLILHSIIVSHICGSSLPPSFFTPPFFTHSSTPSHPLPLILHSPTTSHLLPLSFFTPSGSYISRTPSLTTVMLHLTKTLTRLLHISAYNTLSHLFFISPLLLPPLLSVSLLSLLL